MRYNVLRQFYKRFMIIDIANKRLHLCSSIRLGYNVLERSAIKSFTAVNQIQHFSNTSYLQRKTEMMFGEGENKSFIIDYDGILKAQNDDSILIIDVREQSEINETGKLPGSIHIPMGDVTSTLGNLSEDDFKKKYNKSKPHEDTRIILSCRSGKRSGMVQEELKKKGYENVYNYMGGWLDWESNQK